MEPKPVKPILFLNSPVENTNADIIGMEPYVEQLNAAIDAGSGDCSHIPFWRR